MVICLMRMGCVARLGFAVTRQYGWSLDSQCEYDLTLPCGEDDPSCGPERCFSTLSNCTESGTCESCEYRTGFPVRCECQDGSLVTSNTCPGGACIPCEGVRNLFKRRFDAKIELAEARIRTLWGSRFSGSCRPRFSFLAPRMDSLAVGKSEPADLSIDCLPERPAVYYRRPGPPGDTR
jgi:hypothetical protein